MLLENVDFVNFNFDGLTIFLARDGNFAGLTIFSARDGAVVLFV
jgi:hypothetical protein